MTLHIRYFAWLRERVGTASEMIETNAPTIAALVDELRTRSENHAFAFSDLAAIRAAVDQELMDFDAPIPHAHEVAFFPPMTGG